MDTFGFEEILSHILAFAFVAFMIIGIPLLVKKRTKNLTDPRKGAFAIVEAWKGHRKKHDIFGRRIHAYDKSTLKPVLLGHVSSQKSGGHAQMDLFGTWKRVDENAIKATVSFVRGDGDEMTPRGVAEYVLRIGEEFPILLQPGRRSRAIIGNPPTYIRVLYLHVPEDSLPK